MTTNAARIIVQDRLAFLEREYMSCKDPYGKRLILMNMDSCHMMLMYLHLLDKGKRPRFIVKDDLGAIHGFNAKALT